MGFGQCVLPFGVGEGRDLHGQLYHFLCLEFYSGYIHKEVADALVGRGG